MSKPIEEARQALERQFMQDVKATPYQQKERLFDLFQQAPTPENAEAIRSFLADQVKHNQVDVIIWEREFWRSALEFALGQPALSDDDTVLGVLDAALATEEAMFGAFSGLTIVR